MTTALKTALRTVTKSSTIDRHNASAAIDLALSIPDAGMAMDFLRDWKADRPLAGWNASGGRAGWRGGSGPGSGLQLSRT